MNEEIERAKLIIEFYQNGKIPFFIKLLDYIKEKKNGDSKHNTNNDTSRNNTICNDSISNTWNNEISKIFNG